MRFSPPPERLEFITRQDCARDYSAGHILLATKTSALQQQEHIALCELSGDQAGRQACLTRRRAMSNITHSPAIHARTSSKFQFLRNSMLALTEGQQPHSRDAAIVTSSSKV